jgi:phage tail tape-measure protein
MTEKPRKNTDAITGEPGAHPVGTGVGAAGGAITGAALGAAIGGPTGAAVGTVVGGIAAAYGARGVAEAMNPTTEEEKTGGNTTKSSPS